MGFLTAFNDLKDAAGSNVSNSNVPDYADQNYDKIVANCLKAKKAGKSDEKGAMFIDSIFPPDSSSIGNRKRSKGVEWKRVKDIHRDATLFVDGHCEDDVKQGSLGNCWFVASVACFGLHEKLVREVLPEPEQQDIQGEDYCGIILFKFYRFGEWVEVVVDDYLPTKRAKPVFMHSKEPNEFWAALLEKAYAKLAGSYEALDAGNSSDALTDLTGGVSIFYDFNKDGYKKGESEAALQTKQDKLWRTLHKCLERESLVNISKLPAEGEGLEAESAQGLYVGHAYTVCTAHTVGSGGSDIEGTKLVKIRNPWGAGEWKGYWGDDYKAWKLIDADEKEKMGYSREEDGEFWMTFEDMMRYFDNMTICRIIKTSTTMDLQKKWNLKKICGKWEGESAGGCANNKATFWNNPQIQFQILEADDETVQITLEQRDRRAEKEENHIIGYRIFKLKTEDNTDRVTSKKASSQVWKQSYKDARQVYARYEFEVGTYVIVPTTYAPDINAEFILWIFTEDDANVTEL